MNNGSKTFRSALGGYNREDVNAYIKETDLKHAAELEELKKALDAAKAESAGFAASVQAAVLERDAARERAHADMIAAAELTKAKDGEIAELTKRLNLLKAETEAQVNVINSLREEKSALSAQIDENRNAVENTKKDAEENKIALTRAEADAEGMKNTITGYELRARSRIKKRDQLQEEFSQWLEVLEAALADRSGMNAPSAQARVLSAARSSQELYDAICKLKKASAYAGGNVSVAAVCGWLVWALRI